MALEEGTIFFEAGIVIPAEGTYTVAELDTLVMGDIHFDSRSSYEFNLPIKLQGALAGLVDEVGRIHGSFNRDGNPAVSAADLTMVEFFGMIPDNLNFDGSGFDSLSDFTNVSLDQALEGIKTALQSAITEDGPIYQDIPYINQSAAELLGDGSVDVVQVIINAIETVQANLTDINHFEIDLNQAINDAMQLQLQIGGQEVDAAYDALAALSRALTDNLMAILADQEFQGLIANKEIAQGIELLKALGLDHSATQETIALALITESGDTQTLDDLKIDRNLLSTDSAFVDAWIILIDNELTKDSTDAQIEALFAGEENEATKISEAKSARDTVSGASTAMIEAAERLQAYELNGYSTDKEIAVAVVGSDTIASLGAARDWWAESNEEIALTLALVNHLLDFEELMLDRDVAFAADLLDDLGLNADSTDQEVAEAIVNSDVDDEQTYIDLKTDRDLLAPDLDFIDAWNILVTYGLTYGATDEEIEALFDVSETIAEAKEYRDIIEDASSTADEKQVAQVMLAQLGVEVDKVLEVANRDALIAQAKTYRDLIATGAGNEATPWVITFYDPGMQDVAQIIVAGAFILDEQSTIITTIQGSAETNEIQTLHNNATEGTFTITFDAQTTTALAYNASAAEIETALEALSNITDVTVENPELTEAETWLTDNGLNSGSTDVEIDATFVAEGITDTEIEEALSQDDKIIEVKAARTTVANASTDMLTAAQRLDDYGLSGGSSDLVIAAAIVGNENVETLKGYRDFLKTSGLSPPDAETRLQAKGLTKDSTNFEIALALIDSVTYENRKTDRDILIQYQAYKNIELEYKESVLDLRFSLAKTVQGNYDLNFSLQDLLNNPGVPDSVRELIGEGGAVELHLNTAGEVYVDADVDFDLNFTFDLTNLGSPEFIIYDDSRITFNHLEIQTLTPIDITGSIVVSGCYVTVKEADFSDLALDASALFDDLVTNGYLDENGMIQDSFKALTESSELMLAAAFQSNRQEIYDILQEINQGVSSITLAVKQATLNVDLEGTIALQKDTSDYQYNISELAANISLWDIDLQGHIIANLPMYFPNEDEPMGGTDQDENDDGFGDHILYLNAQFEQPNTFDRIELITPDLGVNFSLLGILQDPSLFLSGVDMALGGVQNIFETNAASNLPMVGDKLKDAATFINDIRTGFLADLRAKVGGKGKLVQLIRESLLDSLGPDGLDLVLDNTDDRIIDINDIKIGWYDDFGTWLKDWEMDDTPGKDTLKYVDALQFDIKLGQDFFSTGIDIPVDFSSTPGLGISVDGGFGFEINWSFDFGFGLSVADGFYLATNKDLGAPELEVGVKAYFDGAPLDPDVITPFSAEGELWVFDMTITDRDRYANEEGFQPSGVFGGLSLDVSGGSTGRLLFSDLGDITELIDVDFGVAADINLDMELRIEGLGVELNGTFIMGWEWDLIGGISYPVIAFDAALNIEDFMDISGTFTFQSDLFSATESDASMLLGVSDIDAFMGEKGTNGESDRGLNISGGNLGLAFYGNKKYAIYGSDFDVEVVGLPNFEAQGTLGILVNTTGGAVNETIMLERMPHTISFTETEGNIKKLRGNPIAFVVEDTFGVRGNIEISKNLDILQFDSTDFAINLTIDSTEIFDISGSGSFEWSKALGFKMISLDLAGYNLTGTTSNQTSFYSADPEGNQGRRLGPLVLGTPIVKFSGFNYDEAGDISVDITLGVTQAAVVGSSGNSPISAKYITGTFTLAFNTLDLDVSIGDSWSIQAGEIIIKIGSFLEMTGRNITINPNASADELALQIGYLAAEVTIGDITFGGTGRNFAIEGDGDFVTLPGFGVSIILKDGDMGSLKWPSWIPLQITEVGIIWADFVADKTDFNLLLSARVNAIEGLPLEVSGSVEGVQIDLDLLAEGKFPFVSIEAVSIEAEGEVFGGELSAAILVGVTRIGGPGSGYENLMVPNSVPLPKDQIKARVLFVGVEGGFKFAGMAGFKLSFGMSELGPLSVSVTCSLPTGILLEPITGLTINNFVGGVEFFQELVSLDSADQLAGQTLKSPMDLSAGEWLSRLQYQVVQQYLRLEQNPDAPSFTAAFTSPMIIFGGATLYSQYLSQYLFNGEILLQIDTTGKILLTGKLNFLMGLISSTARMYADLGNIDEGAATILFLAKFPDQFDMITVKGEFSMGFMREDGQEITADNPADAFEIMVMGSVNYQLPFAGDTLGLRGIGNIRLLFLLSSGVMIMDLDLQLELIVLGENITLMGAAGRLVVDTQKSEVWGVFKLEAGMDFLESYGLEVSAEAFLYLNTTNEIKSETITLPGLGERTYELQRRTFGFQLAGAVVLKNIATNSELKRLNGAFFIEINDEGLKMMVNAEAQIGPSEQQSFEMQALGVLIINKKGFAGRLELEMERSIGPLLELEGTFKTYVNITSEDQSVEIPSLFIDGGYLTPEFLAILERGKGQLLFSETISDSLIETLNNETYTSELADVFTSNAVNLGNSVTVRSIYKNSRWEVVDETAGEGYVLDIDDETGQLGVYVPEATVSKFSFEALEVTMADFYAELINQGYINEQGVIQQAFIDLPDAQSMTLGTQFSDVQEEVYAILEEATGQAGARISEADLASFVEEKEEFYDDLISRGYMDEDGVVQDAFKQLSDSAAMVLDEQFESQKEDIYQLMKEACQGHVQAIDFMDIELNKETIFDELITQGYINSEGIIQMSFRQLSASDQMILDTRVLDLRADIYAILTAVMQTQTIAQLNFQGLGLSESDISVLWMDLQNNGYINADGEVQSAFIALADAQAITLNANFEEHRQAIYDILNNTQMTGVSALDFESLETSREEIFDALKTEGYINAEGDVQDSFYALENAAAMNMVDEFSAMEQSIYDRLLAAENAGIVTQSEFLALGVYIEPLDVIADLIEKGYIKGAQVESTEFSTLGIDEAALFDELISQEYIDSQGFITDEFILLDNAQAMELDAAYEAQRDEIYRVITDAVARSGAIEDTFKQLSDATEFYVDSRFESIKDATFTIVQTLANGRVSVGDFVDVELEAADYYDQLVSQGYIEEEGIILNSFRQLTQSSEMNVDARFALKAEQMFLILEDACVAAEDGRFIGVPRGPPQVDTTLGTTGSYIVILGLGTLNIIDMIELQGGFRIEISTDGFKLQVDAKLDVGVLGYVDVMGYLSMSWGGDLIGRIALELDAGFGGDAGLGIRTESFIEINTYSTTQTILRTDGSSVDIDSGVRIHMEGEIEFLDFAQASGMLDIKFASGSFELIFDLTFSLGGLNFSANGGAGIYSDGLVLKLAVSVDAKMAVFEISASGTFMLNTTGTDRLDVKANSFYLNLTGYIEILKVLKFNASFTIEIVSGEWRFDFSADISFFGLATLSSYGWLDSSGNFDIYLSGDLTLGSSSFGLSGGFYFRVQSICTTDSSGNPYYRFSLSGGASVKARVFGVKVKGIELDFSFYAEGAGTVKIELSVTVKIKVLFGKIKKTARFTIGYLELPKPVYLAGNAGASKAASQSWSGGSLYLNMGSRGGYRDLANSALDEAYSIKQTGGDANNATIAVTAMGRTRVYENVTAIYANAGSGNDFIQIDDSVKVPVVLNGDAGEDVLIHNGTGSVVLNGGSGADYLETSSSGTVAINGNGDDDYMVYAGEAQASMIGGDGDDHVEGGVNNDTLDGGSGSDEIIGGGGIDTIYAGDGDDLIKLGFDGFSSVVHANHANSDVDFLIVTAASGDENIEISSLSANGLSVISVGESITATGIEEVLIDAGAGADYITVNDLNGSGIEKVTVKMGKQIETVGTMEVVEDLDEDDATTDDRINVEAPILSISDDNAADTLHIMGSASDDSFIVNTITENPDTNQMEETQVIRKNIHSFVIADSIRAEGDSLIIDSGAGNDALDLSGLDDPDPDDITSYPDLMAIKLWAGAGHDELIGSPFNDELNSGTGDDTVTGGEGLDTFIDESGSDTLIEVQDTDMSLFGNAFVTGRILTDSGADFSTSGPVAEETLRERIREDDPDFGLTSLGDRYASGAIVENIEGIFEEAILIGGTDNNTMVIGDQDNTIYVDGASVTVTPWINKVSLDNKSNDMNVAVEYYIVNAGGGLDVSIDDSGELSGFDQLEINGSNEADSVSLNAAGSDSARVGIILMEPGHSDQTDRITFRSVERLAINTFAGDDNILSNDTAVITIINMGSGEDEVVVGVVPMIPDTGNKTLEYPDGIPVADTENMTNGNSATLFVLGQSQNDRFEVNHNRARLYLHGGAGNDRFLLKTFLVLKENANNPDEVTNLSSLFGGAGMNRYSYLQNAPVEINGGPGIDTLVVLGTPIGDVFVITDTYVAGAGRITTFMGIESVEVDTGGGDDEIYVLSTGDAFETTVVGGSGDDTIHIGGDHPPLVFDPEAFTYTPPAFQVQLPPELVFTDHTLNLSGFTFDAKWRWHVDPEQWVQSYVNRLEAIWRSIIPHFKINSVEISEIQARVKHNFWWWWWDPVVSITVNTFKINYSIGRLESRAKVVQPAPITVDPPAFAFKAPASFDISKILGRLTIQGGDQFEDQGDKVIVHNQDGSSSVGRLTERTTRRMVQTGENADGSYIYEQDADETGLLFDTFQSLEGIGLPVDGTRSDGEPLYGIEFEGIEAMDIRLSDGNDNFTIETTPEDMELLVIASGGDDTINVQEIYGDTTILGGAGDDTVNVADESILQGINAKFVVDGDAHIEEALVPVETSEFADILDDLPNVFINSEPNSGLSYNGVYYELPELAPILEDDGNGHLIVHAVVPDENGSIVEDFVQEKAISEKGIQMTGVQKETGGQLIYLDEEGNETIENTGIPVIIADDAGALVFYNEDGYETFTDTGLPSIITDPSGTQVYLDDSWNKTFLNTGRKSYVTDFEAGTLRYVDSLPPVLVVNGDGPDFNVYEDYGSPEFYNIKVLLSQDGVNFYAAVASGTTVRLNGDLDATFVRSYDLGNLSSARFIRVVSKTGYGDSLYSGFDLDAIGIINRPDEAAVTFPTYLSSNTIAWKDSRAINQFGAGYNTTIVLTGAPDDRGVGLSPKGYGVTYVASILPNDIPSLIPVNRTTAISYTRSEDSKVLIASDGNGTPYNDIINITNTADSADISGVFDTYQVALDNLYATGNLLFNRVLLESATVGSGMPVPIFHTNFDGLNVYLGAGNDQWDVLETHTGATQLSTGAGMDQVNVRKISGDTTINGEAGADVIHLGSLADFDQNENGHLNDINGWLTLNGGSGSDEVSIDDTSDTWTNQGSLSSNELTGLGMGPGIKYSALESLTLNLGSGADEFTIESTHAGDTYIDTAAGADTIHVKTIAYRTEIHTNTGNDHVNVGSDSDAAQPWLYSTLNDIDDLLILMGEADDDTLAIYDGGDAKSNQGKLTPNKLTGLGMGNTDQETIEESLGIEYDSFKAISISLGIGADTFYIEDTHAGSTVVNGDRLSILSDADDLGDEDTLLINHISGETTINAGPSDDVIKVNYDHSANQTFVNGLGDVLTLHGQFGSDRYEIGLAGQGSSLIHVEDKQDVEPVDPGLTQDFLTIMGTDNSDHFLFRANTVASITHDQLGDQTGEVEQVNYDGNINGGLTVYGRNGNDEFVFDDNSGITTVYGDGGDDTFQIGQMFNSPREANSGLSEEDWFDTVFTTQGYLSSGISSPATLLGGNGEDTFIVYHNLATLSLEGGLDNDTFAIYSFVELDPEDAKKRFTNINGGQGADFITYTVNAPVNVDGGEGVDTVVITGTEYGDDFVVTPYGVYGAGRYTQFVGVESIEVDAAEGNDTFFIQGSAEGVDLSLIGGLGSDTFNIAGGNDSGSPITVVSNDLRGHSGIISHEVESNDPNYNGCSGQNKTFLS